MDYVELIKSLKVKYGAEGKAVIAFGGSYGGMLAAWMRMKHPHVIQGALASSAPIFYFKGAEGAPETRFFDIITEDFNQTTPGNTTDNRCGLGIREGFELLADVKADQTLWAEFSTLFKLCENVTTI
jgi:pimeloyl-ACP methyl ester carboxylesterase